MRNKYHAGVNLYEMSTYKSCWRWSVSQFSTCMSLFRHGCQRQSFWNSHIDSQMYTFLDQMNWQFDQVLMDPNSSQNFAYWTQMTWNKRLLCFLFRENLLGINGFSSFVLCHLSPVHKINVQSPITAILYTQLLHEFMVNVKCRMDWSYRKPYVCLSFNFLKQYSANGTCLTSVNMQEYVNPLWLLWKS